MVPSFEGFGVFGAVAYEDAEVVEPDSGEDYVVIVGEASSDLLRECVEAGLMAEFVGRVRVGGDVGFDCVAIGCGDVTAMRAPVG